MLVWWPYAPCLVPLTCRTEYPATAAVDGNVLITIGAAVVDATDVAPIPYLGQRCLETGVFPGTGIRPEKFDSDKNCRKSKKHGKPGSTVINKNKRKEVNHRVNF